MMLPQELERFAGLPDLQFRGNGEWSSACPVCGGGGKRYDHSDRFRIFAASGGHNARVWCRQCNYFSWANNDTDSRPSPEQIAKAQQIQQSYLEAENKRLRARISQLKETAYWKGYHDAMKEQHRALWRQAGIPNEFQDYWELGFMPEYRGRVGDKEFTSPAMTIPYFEPGRQPSNVQYRLTNPPKPNDKYRFTKGLKPSLWLADPDQPPKGECLLVEGMKKAGVCFVELVAKANQNLSVVAVPSKTPSEAMVNGLKDCEVVYVALDPDAYTKEKKQQQTAAARVGEMLGNRARYVHLPAKADDLFVDYGFTAGMFGNYIRQSTVTA